ncbi:DUF4400 domain-containing protein [Pseudomonas aeruginosa]|nr:DUF4400 domain-containing protein [Pseudomonas aeruginosa]
MADTIEEKWPKGIVASLAFLFILILMLATLAPNLMIDKVLEVEHRWSKELLAESDYKRVVDNTNSLYTSLVIDSGAKQIVSDLFMPRGNGTVDAFEESVGWWFQYLDSRGVALQKIIYQIIYRGVLTLYWLPFFVVVVVPAIFAGYMRWQAKRYGFDYSSPFLNNNAAALLSWGSILMVLSLLAPLPLPPLAICTLIIIVMPILISVLIRNLPKQI